MSTRNPIKPTAAGPATACGANRDEVCGFGPPATPIPTLDGGNTAPAPTDNAPVATGISGVVIVTSAGEQPVDPSLRASNEGNLNGPQVTTVTSGSDVVASNAPVSASSSKGGSSLSGGAVAGVAIGALIAGALLAFAAAFFLFKRRNKPRDSNVGYNKNHNYTDSSPELVMLQKSAGRNSPYVQVSQTPIPPPVAVAVPTPAPVQQPPKDVIGSILPAAAHDSEIQSRISALFSTIHRHIDMFYRDAHASITPSMEPDLIRFGAKDVNMAELLQDCSSPTTAIKHALAAYVLAITGPRSSDEGETLFPNKLKGASSHGFTSGSDSNLQTALTYHRRLSVYLYTSTSSPTTTSRRHQSDIREAAEHFSLTFFPWANPGSDDQEKEDDLTRVISEAMETRVWLFGQPSEYEFRWDGVGTRGIAVSPELVRKDGSGRGRVLVESNVAGL